MWVRTFCVEKQVRNASFISSSPASPTGAMTVVSLGWKRNHTLRYPHTTGFKSACASFHTDIAVRDRLGTRGESPGQKAPRAREGRERGASNSEGWTRTYNKACGASEWYAYLHADGLGHDLQHLLRPIGRHSDAQRTSAPQPYYF